MPLQNSIIIDNFYENPLEVREFALKQKFQACHLPRYHTKSFANMQLYNKIQNIMYPFAGKLSGFYIPDYEVTRSHDNKLFRGDSYNGAFICGLGKLVPWAHKDTKSERFKPVGGVEDIPEYQHWAGVLYLTPNPPKNSGTSILRCNSTILRDNIEMEMDGILSKDLTKWDKVDSFGNVFNRLILYRSNQHHTCDNNFGTDMDNSRLTQLFFFITEH
jgi:hypothetical protein